MKRLLICVLILTLMTAVLLNPQYYINCVKNSLTSCYTTLIPSLCAFMMLSQLFCESTAGDTVASFLSPVMKKVFCLNKTETKIFLSSLIGGYPCGAKMVSNALKDNKITLSSATRLLKFCINPSPSYLILAVGVGLYKNKQIGAVFLLSNLISSLVMAFLTRRKTMQKEAQTHSLSFSQTLVKSINDGTNAMVSICGFTLFFSVIMAFLKGIGLFNVNQTLSALISLSLDVVTGINNTYQTSTFLSGIAISFGGMSVIFQCMTMLKEQKIKFLKIIPSRILHSVLTGLISYFIIKISDFPIETMTHLKPALSIHSTELSMIFVATCIVFLVSLKRSEYNEKTFRK